MKETAPRHSYYYLGFLVLALMVGYSYFLGVHRTFLKVTSFDECIKAGYERILTYPEQCHIPGKYFTNPLQKPVTKELRKNDYQNYSYIIEGGRVSFTNGIGVLPPNQLLRNSTTTLVVTSLVVHSDFNSDRVDDAVFVLEGRRGDQSIYYLGGALSLAVGFTGTNALYVDQGIEFATVSIKNGNVIVEYSKIGQSAKLKKTFKVEDGILKDL